MGDELVVFYTPDQAKLAVAAHRNRSKRERLRDVLGEIHLAACAGKTSHLFGSDVDEELAEVLRAAGYKVDIGIDPNGPVFFGSIGYRVAWE